MDRRTYLATLAGIATGTVAGCVGSGAGGDDNGGGDDTPSPTPTEPPAATPAMGDPSFERTGDCDSGGSATVSVASNGHEEVVVEGCIVGANGCSQAVLGSVDYAAAADELTVVVGTEEERGEDEACTQALVYRGYRVAVPFEGGTPATTAVVHDGAEGRREVARADTA